MVKRIGGNVAIVLYAKTLCSGMDAARASQLRFLKLLRIYFESTLSSHTAFTIKQQQLTQFNNRIFIHNGKQIHHPSPSLSSCLSLFTLA